MDHDSGYRQLFSHPQMVIDLLHGYVEEPWVAHLDFSTLEKVPGSFVADNLRDRENDLIWRLRVQGEWLYVYLLLEFQSSVDPLMAVRLMTYVGLLYQDLDRRKALSPRGALPPVVPIVLYNGGATWTAPTQVADLILPAPAGLDTYRPRFHYLLIDESRYAGPAAPATNNLVAALFGLENSRTPDDLRAVVAKLIAWLGAPEQATLHRAFANWIQRVLLPARLPGVTLDAIADLKGLENMLAERVKEWTREWERQGLEKGMQQGLQQGLLQGEAAVLLRLLTRKFGELPPEARRRIQSADAETLLLWSDRVLDAARLDDVLEPEH